jgi:sec-independent protein translocase protein TatB
VFGVSFTELMVIAIVALIVVGPQRLPEMLGKAGRWVAKLRTITSEMRRQTGIDDILRQEGIQGGLNELRSLVRPGALGSLANLTAPPTTARSPAASPVVNPADPYGDSVEVDRDREYPPEGADAYGAIPEDLLSPPPEPAPAFQPPAPAAIEPATTTAIEPATTTAIEPATTTAIEPLAPPVELSPPIAKGSE